MRHYHTPWTIFDERRPYTPRRSRRRQWIPAVLPIPVWMYPPEDDYE